MSRYTIDSTNPGIEIVVGWDPPLRSLFAQVSDCTITDDEADPMLLWEDFGSIDELASAIAPWATLPDDIRQTLAVESGEKPARRPPAFERPESVVFSGQRCRVLQAVFPHGGIALQLFTDDNTRAPFATATVCIPAYAIRENSQTALVKDYEENAGMLEALTTAGIVEVRLRRAPRRRRPAGRRGPIVNAPDPNARIRRARITKMPEGLSDPMPEVLVTLDDGSEHRLFSFYPDEISFEPEDFIGLTVREAHALKARRDIDYLRS